VRASVQSVDPNSGAGKLIIMGTMLDDKLVQYIHHCTRKHATVVPPPPPLLVQALLLFSCENLVVFVQSIFLFTYVIVSLVYILDCTYIAGECSRSTLTLMVHITLTSGKLKHIETATYATPYQKRD
jgi:hypothetical protein